MKTIDKKAYMKLWRIANRKRLTEYNKKWRVEHPEYDKEYKKEWRVIHPDYFKSYRKKHALAHPEKELEKAKKRKETGYYKKYSVLHQEQRNENERRRKINHPERLKQYRQTLNGKEASRRHAAKRIHFKCIPLNKHFKGSIKHHVDEEHVIYIPKELHESVRHSVLKNRNMELINAKAFEFLNGAEEDV